MNHQMNNLENVTIGEKTVFEARLKEIATNKEIKVIADNVDSLINRTNVYLIDGSHQLVNIDKVTRTILIKN